MNIKFNIEKSTDASTEVLIDRILYELKKQDYHIVSTTHNKIVFNNSRWGFVTRGEQLKKIDKGIFELSSLKNATKVTFTAYISITLEVILIPSIILLGIFFKFYIISAGGVLFLLQFLFRIDAARKSSIDIMDFIGGIQE